MATNTISTPVEAAVPVANDRLKNSYGNWFWGSIMVAALFHFALLAFWPNMEAEDVSFESEQMEQVEVVQEFEIPPPPEAISRPAVPVLSTDISVSDDITIAEVTFDENPVNELPPPPSGTGVSVADQPTFTPFEVRPELRNRNEFAQALTRGYPPMLKDAGIGGTVLIWVYINEQGEVENTQIQESSGYEDLDNLASELMRNVAQFSPALNRDTQVPVWVALPVTFQTE